MLEAYRRHVAERAALGLPPLPLSAAQVGELIDLLKTPPAGREPLLRELIAQRVPAGVDEAAGVKAAFLADVAFGRQNCAVMTPVAATRLLGTMLGGYNIPPLVDLLDDAAAGEAAADALKSTLLVYEAFDQVRTKAEAGNDRARSVLRSWAEAEWFTSRPELPKSLLVVVLKVDGETSTDDLSPGSDAWSRPDIPLHALSMLKHARPGIIPDKDGQRGPVRQIEALKAKGLPVAYAGDVVGTGSSRKSAVNSLLWFIGRDLPYVPNKRAGGVCLGGKIAPIFRDTLEDAGALPIELDVSGMKMGDIVELRPYDGVARRDGVGVAEFKLRSQTVFDSVRAGGRIALTIGRRLTERARQALDLAPSTAFRRSAGAAPSGRGFTLAQKIVGRACGLPPDQGVRPGSHCEPHITSVGSPDSTGPMTRAELADLACRTFAADLVMQSFCHTAAYPRRVDVQTQHSLPAFITARGGISLRPGDGIIHSWLNRMLLPDTVGTGGDSHTRFPIGISFPAGSGMVAFAAAVGIMPLDMPESVLVRFTGTMQAGITLRDMVNAVPYFAAKAGLLTVEKAGKVNAFSGRILEIEGLPAISVEQAFDFSAASAERSAAACAMRLEEAAVIDTVRDNVDLLQSLLDAGYEDAGAIQRRIAAMKAWLADPSLLRADADAAYAAVLDIDLNELREPLVACPNDPDDVRPLSAVAGRAIDEVFIGSCMTGIGDFRAVGAVVDGEDQVPARLWIAPPTRMDQSRMVEEGLYAVLGAAGARAEIPGCSLCMGNQARVHAGATVFSTSTRNFPNRLGKGADVYLGSAELGAVCARLGRLPTYDEYMADIRRLDADRARINQRLTFAGPAGSGPQGRQTETGHARCAAGRPM